MCYHMLSVNECLNLRQLTHFAYLQGNSIILTSCNLELNKKTTGQTANTLTMNLLLLHSKTLKG